MVPVSVLWAMPLSLCLYDGLMGLATNGRRLACTSEDTQSVEGFTPHHLGTRWIPLRGALVKPETKCVFPHFRESTAYRPVTAVPYFDRVL